MSIKDFGRKTIGWLRDWRSLRGADYQPDVNNEGLISGEDEGQQTNQQGGEVIVKKVSPQDKRETLERLSTSFDKLIEQLQGINEHLSRQAAHYEDLVSRIDKLPGLLESFPAIVETQKQLTQQLLEQLKMAAAKQERFVDAVEKIPAETAKQSDALVDIDHQLAAAADTDVQMAESFNKFNETLDKLNQSTASQTDAICQLSKTFATSDRYLKYIISRQNKRFIWMFIAAIGVCVVAILILAGIIIYLRQ